MTDEEYMNDIVEKVKVDQRWLLSNGKEITIVGKRRENGIISHLEYRTDEDNCVDIISTYEFVHIRDKIIDNKPYLEINALYKYTNEETNIKDLTVRLVGYNYQEDSAWYRYVSSSYQDTHRDEFVDEIHLEEFIEKTERIS